MNLLSSDMLNRTDLSNELDLTPVAGRIGAEVRGIRLSADMESRIIDAINAALVRHKVLFFRDQSGLSDEGQEGFAQRLGRIVSTPTLPTAEGTRFLLELDSVDGGAASSWHTDATFAVDYPAISVLRGVTLPAVGGDTLWANVAAAYDGLPSPLKSLVDQLRAIHTNGFAAASASSRDQAGGYRGLKAGGAPSIVYETEHPVVRVHPVSGERALLTGHFLKNFVGFNVADSQRLFATLLDHISQPENTVRWRWRLGDVAIWDNRSTQHRAIADFGMQRRTMRRATVAGDVPYGVDGRLSIAIAPRPRGDAA